MSDPYSHLAQQQQQQQQQQDFQQQQQQQSHAQSYASLDGSAEHQLHYQHGPSEQTQYSYAPPPPPPPNVYYAAPAHSSVTSLNTLPGSTPPLLPPLHHYPNSAPIPSVHHPRSRPPMSLAQLPAPTDSASGSSLPVGYMPHLSAQHGQSQQPMVSPYGMSASPYHTPGLVPDGTSASSSRAGEGGMSDYFPPYSTATTPPLTSIAMSNPNDPFPPQHPHHQQHWQSIPPAHSGQTEAKIRQRGGAGSSAKTSRQQFTACGACRHRRVKCDLKDRQEAAERDAAKEDEESGVGPIRTGKGRKRVSCSNCVERGTNCVDEYAPLKAAKQLRRGKRISEIEMLYGKSAASAAVTHRPDEVDAVDDPTLSPTIKGKDKEVVIPDLTKEFFESPFFRRFQVQRPIIEPAIFVARYFASPTPCAAAMGPEGAILCHVLYAWAASYGVDEHGELDVPEGGGVPDGTMVDLSKHGQDEVKRERDRQRRFNKMRGIIEVILLEMDACGVMRKPTWDGVRAMLLLLPLTEGVATMAERATMYDVAISQVYLLCSFAALGYDGKSAATSAVNGGVEDEDDNITRIRIYWYSFVHEGITTGLKGGRLHLDAEDLETMQDTIRNRALVHRSGEFTQSMRFATAPINLALACRLINKALTGPGAKRRTSVNADHVKEAWEALERCWEEFEAIRYSSPGSSYNTPDEVVRFADGWKIFLFEAQNVIRTNLEARLTQLSSQTNSAYISDPLHSAHNSPSSADVSSVQHLLDIARSKCEVQTRQIMDIIRRHVNSRFFEWDASLVRDGTYYAAKLVAQSGGSDEDVATCIQALNELRWAHAKSWGRSDDLRRHWRERRASGSMTSTSSVSLQGWDPAYAPALDITTTGRSGSISALDSSSLSNSPFDSPTIISPTFPQGQGQTQGPITFQTRFGAPSEGMPPSREWQGEEMVAPPSFSAVYGGSVPPPMSQHMQQQRHIQQQHQHQQHQHHQPQQQQRGTDLSGQYILQPDGSQIWVSFH